MTTADLGYPILLSILFCWVSFALLAFFTTFLKKKNLQEFKNYMKRITDPHPHRRGSNGGRHPWPEKEGV